MFRMPIKHPPWRANQEPELSDESFSYESPPRPMSGSKSFVLIKTQSSSPETLKPAESTKNPDFSLRAELEVIKNALESEQRKNHHLSNEITELESTIFSLKTQLKEEKKTSQVLKQKNLEKRTEEDIEKSKFFAKIQVLQDENRKLIEKVNEYKFVETQEAVIRQEMEQKYLKKFLKLRESLKIKAEKLRKKEKDLNTEKNLFSLKVSEFINKFQNFELKIPALREALKPVINN
jgi:chromosome segregation ATPase